MFIKITTFRKLKFNNSETLFLISVFRSCLSISKRMRYNFFFVLKEITKFHNNKKFTQICVETKKTFLINTYISI